MNEIMNAMDLCLDNIFRNKDPSVVNIIYVSVKHFIVRLLVLRWVRYCAVSVIVPSLGMDSIKNRMLKDFVSPPVFGYVIYMILLEF